MDDVDGLVHCFHPSMPLRFQQSYCPAQYCCDFFFSGGFAVPQRDEGNVRGTHDAFDLSPGRWRQNGSVDWQKQFRVVTDDLLRGPRADGNRGDGVILVVHVRAAYGNAQPAAVSRQIDRGGVLLR